MNIGSITIKTAILSQLTGDQGHWKWYQGFCGNKRAMLLVMFVAFGDRIYTTTETQERRNGKCQVCHSANKLTSTTHNILFLPSASYTSFNSRYFGAKGVQQYWVCSYVSYTWWTDWRLDVIYDNRPSSGHRSTSNIVSSDSYTYIYISNLRYRIFVIIRSNSWKISGDVQLNISSARRLIYDMGGIAGLLFRNLLMK